MRALRTDVHRTLVFKAVTIESARSRLASIGTHRRGMLGECVAEARDKRRAIAGQTTDRAGNVGSDLDVDDHCDGAMVDWGNCWRCWSRGLNKSMHPEKIREMCGISGDG